ncbi:hypothetical protein BAUCODRAFT_31846 [Baudoinia panamericana UAMH 10762]|uniref:Uncharacterized protein n=1 Tax=Baudoinia panamericana (strain UAMH 10762) TaxID=717646 RepID=M2MMB9_BAUPA|nr:uncharacterized protein BAUCODRAFT_31846 [Baudoinia panamericana UAMH 10762]EMC97841.1 hypothetical protein BAUCODRAFT_31846 [Baudoinia panamericana UAMH 10762]
MSDGAPSSLAGSDLQQKVATLETSNEYGIGFDFTPSYAAVAVSFVNGSNVPLAKIEGNRQWRVMMSKVSLTDDYPYHWWDKQWTVSVLAPMIEALVSVGEAQLGGPIVAASATMAQRNAISRWGHPATDLVMAAFSKAKIRYLPIVISSYLGEPLLYPENSIQAGHGLGLCRPYNSSQTCLHDGTQPQLAYETYYLVGYYANALEVTSTTPSLSAYGTSPAPKVDYQLGAEMRYEKLDEAYYWEEVRKFLSMPFVNIPRRKPTKVILYGEHGSDMRLRETVKDVLKAFMHEDAEMVQWVDDGLGPTYVGAMGAAEFAKRKPYWTRKDLNEEATHEVLSE